MGFMRPVCNRYVDAPHAAEEDVRLKFIHSAAVLLP